MVVKTTTIERATAVSGAFDPRVAELRRKIEVLARWCAEIGRT
jgi:hypothetical protein